MKVFAVFAKINLINKPEWLDDFRLKYDEPYEFHITLKQPCFLEEERVVDIKNKLQKFFEEFSSLSHKIDLIFNKIELSVVENKGGYIMLGLEDSVEVSSLQSKIIKLFPDCKNYEKPELQEYEENFLPHITIGRRLDSVRFEEAKKELGEEVSIHGTINEIILAMVPNKYTAENSKNPENLTIYKL